MKKILLKVVESTFLQTKRLMLILGVLIFTINLYGGEDHSYTMNAGVAETGGGKVYVSKSEIAIIDVSTNSWKSSSSQNYEDNKDQQISNINFWVYANADPGYYFNAWSDAVTGSNNPGTYLNKTLNASADNVTKTTTATFNSIVEFPYGNTITLYTDPVSGEVLPAKIQIKVNKSTYLTITPNNTAFSVVTTSPVTLNGAVGEYVTIQITAATGTAEGDYDNAIKLSPNNTTLNDGYLYEPKDEYLKVSILPSPTITFNPPNPVGGEYTYQQTNIIPKPNPVKVIEQKEVDLLDGNDGVIELVATPATGYRVYRWISTHGGVEEVDYLSGNKKLVNWTKDATVTVEFTEDKYASFFVKETPSVKYNDLNAALEAAASSSTKTVVVDPTYNNTAKCNGGYLRAGDYTIPDGYTLLVPADDTYTTLADKTNPTDEDWVTEGSLAARNFCKLIIEEGTTLNVDGVLCVYAKWNYGNTNKGRMKPGTYGWIEMENNSVININDATLHALGYITNIANTQITEDNINQVGRVVANENAIVYEIFVMDDWRGGSAITGATSSLDQLSKLMTIASGGASGLVKNSAKVFPMSQYYIQCIEAPITFNYGSKEKLQTMVNISTFYPMATFDFIIPNKIDDATIASGLFRLGDKTKVTKYYDVGEDRLKLIVEGEDQEIPTMLHSLTMDLAAGSTKIPVSSTDYTLPINNNMDIVIKNGSSVTIPSGSDLCFLSGSSLTIGEGSYVEINSNVYVYDANEKSFHDITSNTAVNGKGYFGSGNDILRPLPYRPGNKFIRTSDAIEDAKFHIDGTLTVGGSLYTTAGGANITSGGGGRVVFNSKVLKDTTSQVWQSGLAYYYQIPITIAKLRNAVGSFSAGNDIEVGQQYIYYSDLNEGTWSLPIAGISLTNVPELKITLPTQSIVQGNIECTLTEPIGVDDFTFEVSDFDVSVNDNSFSIGSKYISGGKLYIPITYSSNDKHGEYSAKITIKNANSKFVLNKEIDLTVIEDYKPAFNVTAVTNFSSTVNVPQNAAVTFSLVDNNVTTIWNDATLGSRLSWTYEIIGDNAEEFDFDYGKGAEKLSNAKVTFVPQSEGNKSATLKLTATYTDGTDHIEITSQEISLSGVATLNNNTLKFATPFPDPIYIEDDIEFLLFSDCNNENDINIRLTPTGVIEIIGDGTVANPYKVKPLSAGVVEVSVSQSASSTIKGIEDGTMKYSIQVKSKELLLTPLDLCVDNYDKFSIHTVSAKSVAFNNDAIVFTSKESQSAIWEMQFKGVPQYVGFTLSGTNNWLVQQSSDGKVWEALQISTGTFDGSLLPTTRRLRFTYAMGNSEGSLTGFCITELDLSASADKVYLPINTDGSTSSVQFELIHTKDLTFDEIDELSVAAVTNNTGTDAEPYLTTTVTISPKEQTGVDQSYTLKVSDGKITKSVVIRTYSFPQLLPINLGTDSEEKFYFTNLVGELNTKYVIWDEDSKEIIFQTPEGGQIEARYATFVFDGAPYSISFEVDGDVNSSNWRVLEGEDVSSLTQVATNPIIDGQTITYELDYTSKYVRIDNISTNMSEIRLSNFVIEGKPEVFTGSEELLFNQNQTERPLSLIVVNLDKVRFELSDPINFAFKQEGNDTELTTLALSKDAYNGLGYNKYCDVSLNIVWKAQNTVDEGKLIVYDDVADTVMIEVRLLGADQFISQGNSVESGLYTGIPDGYTYHGEEYVGYDYHQINLSNTFDENGVALFDYLFIYGPTTTTEDDVYNITAPGRNGELRSSNAKTPYYVYRKSEPNAEGKSLGYQFVTMVENANTPDKAGVEGVFSKDTTTFINVQDSLRIYMTGFAPYATTGYTKQEEGVWFFRGRHGAKLDVYLEDCHIFSRNKTEHGNAFYGNKEGGETFQEGFARGSGGVLVFENTESVENVQDAVPFEVSIHTMGNNLLKSNYGCFYILLSSMKAYQISAPIHVHMASAAHVRSSKTTLNFDDLWPKAVDANNKITDTKRTNGYLGLKKQSNNAPSIDLGNPYTEVNFNGGQIELQNAQIVSENYKTTLAISYRSGEYGGDDVGIKLSYGIGTDSVGGTVNFNDGTITVEPMWVKEGYKQYYLLDTMPDGSDIRRNVGTASKPIYEYQTSCLRCPKNTYVYGGSVCFLRACQHVTSKGGAPKDGPNGKFLGQYVYALQEGDVLDATTQLVKNIAFPHNVDGLYDYHTSHSYTYGTNSITPDGNDKLYFWIPDGYGGVTAEQDKFMSIWKACMTEIRAGLGGVVEGGIGGDTPIEPNEEVKYFLYCKIDDNIHNIIRDKDDKGAYTYKAPVEVPSVASSYFDGEKYTQISPTLVSDSVEYQVLSDTAYTITDKVYYITTATADIWQTFTAPFDVANIYVVETFDENSLAVPGTTRAEILQVQARHNADFAAFFAVAMAIGTDKSFEKIFESYLNWAKIEDEKSGLYTKGTDYTKRGMYPLIPYVVDTLEDGSVKGNWTSANFYLNHNGGDWTLDDTSDFGFMTRWQTLKSDSIDDRILLHKGETYSMLFPYCVGCGASLADRTDWDYWSGKFLIFESVNVPQTINGRDFLNDTIVGSIFSEEMDGDNVKVTGNSTFAFLETEAENVYVYETQEPNLGLECFLPIDDKSIIYPTTAFLYGEVPTIEGASVLSISRMGKIKYRSGDDNSGGTTTGSEHVPTINGGSDLFVTSIAEGINIAVSEPQSVGVFSATGALLYSGWVEASVDVNLVVNGVYVVVGENNSVKVLY